ncbi:MAG: tail fiber domain-containing protein [Nitrospirota bacterium]
MKTSPHQIFARTLIFLSLVAVGQTAYAVVPAPDGCYPGFTTAEGCNALKNLTTGAANTAVGWFSLFSAGAANNNTGVGAGALALNTADSNTAVGTAALILNTTGTGNTGIGTAALVFNDGGNFNTATGSFALQSNTAGGANTAVGFQALQSNTDGNGNTATGANALFHNNASENTAFGDSALVFNTIGNNNTAIGADALENNTVGVANTATGAFALVDNISGQGNTATGIDALSSNTTANFNTAMGNSALSSNITGGGNTAIGSTALANSTTGSGNIGLGNNAGANVSTASSAICIGNVGKDVNNSCFISSIRGVQTQNANAIPVLIDSDGQLGTASSSRRFKKDIQLINKNSEAILALKPVTFHYKSDKTNTPQFGLIAEEVAQVNPDLIVRDENGEIYTVRYDAVNAMLLNEFLKEHKAFLEEQKKVQKLEAALAAVNERLKEQDAKIERVSVGIVTNMTAPQVARVP